MRIQILILGFKGLKDGLLLLKTMRRGEVLFLFEMVYMLQFNFILGLNFIFFVSVTRVI